MTNKDIDLLALTYIQPYYNTTTESAYYYDYLQYIYTGIHIHKECVYSTVGSSSIKMQQRFPYAIIMYYILRTGSSFLLLPVCVINIMLVIVMLLVVNATTAY